MSVDCATPKKKTAQRLLRFPVSVVLLLAAASIARPAVAVDKAVSFKTDLMPLLSSQCMFCHVTGAENGGLNLGRREAYKALMAPSTEAPMPRVTPGDAEKSYLIHKLRGTHVDAGGNGARMPMTDPPRPIDAGQLDLFVKWVEAGASDN